jgi:hypothetical protein
VPLASLLLAAAAAHAAVAVSTRAYALPDLIAEVQDKGEGAVLTAPLTDQVGLDDPTTAKVLHYPEGSDKLTRSVYVSQKQAAYRTGEPTRPHFVLLVTERATSGLIERRYLRLDDDGTLEQATVVRDKIGSDGAMTPGGRTVESVPGDKARDWLQHENDFYFHGKYRRQKEAP